MRMRILVLAPRFLNTSVNRGGQIGCNLENSKQMKIRLMNISFIPLRGYLLSHVNCSTRSQGPMTGICTSSCKNDNNTNTIIQRNFTLGSKLTKSHDKNSRMKSKTSSNTLVESSKQPGAVSISLGEKVKENAKTATYGGIILIGLAVTGAMAYVILSELFSGDSPNNVYTKSFQLCKANQEVLDTLGSPIKCYGEETRRGWRRHVAHHEFFQNNVKYLRMRFYIEGKFNKGTVHVEKIKNEKGKYKYSYLKVDVDSYPPRRIEIDVNNF